MYHMHSVVYNTSVGNEPPFQMWTIHIKHIIFDNVVVQMF